jgi:hypothetical protein
LSQSYWKFQVLTTANMKITAFRDIAPCSHVEVDRSFGGTYYLHRGFEIPDDGGSTRSSETSVYFNVTTPRCNSKAVTLISGKFSQLDAQSAIVIYLLQHSGKFSRLDAWGCSDNRNALIPCVLDNKPFTVSWNRSNCFRQNLSLLVIHYNLPIPFSVETASLISKPNICKNASCETCQVWTNSTKYIIRPEVLKLCPPPPRWGDVGLLGRGPVGCMRDIFVLNEIWVQCKIYIFW